MTHSVDSVTRQLRFHMKMGGSLSSASEMLRKKGVPDHVLKEAILKVETGDVTNKMSNLVNVILSSAILGIIALATAIFVIVWYARHGQSDAGVILVMSHAVTYIILASILTAFVNFMVHGARAKFTWALYAIFVSEMISLLLVSAFAGVGGLSLGLVIAGSIMVRYVTYMAFIHGPSSAQTFILAAFFFVISLLASHLISQAVASIL
jgi:hypothetical protein